MNLRSDKKQYPIFWILENVLTIENETITGCRLPTAKVLLYFLAFYLTQQESEENKLASAAINATLELILAFYQRVTIPNLFRNEVREK